MNSKTLQDLSVLVLATLFVTLLVWLPHLLRLNFYGLNFAEGFNTIYRNFDGIEYIIIAKSNYAERIIAAMPQQLPHTYYAAHFPFYSWMMLPFAPFIGFLKSMLFISLASTIAAVIAFYFLVRDFKLTHEPVYLSLVFLILPARWLIAHSVGSSEPTFIFFTIMAFYFFLKHEEKRDRFFLKFEQSKKFSYITWTAIFGVLAQLTRPPGILLLFALGIYILWKYHKEKFSSFIKSVLSYYPLALIPLSLIAVFALYGVVYNDFYAYFHSGDNIHLSFPPFQVFNINQYWVGSIWLEDIIYIYILGLLAGLMLLRIQILKPLGIYVLTYVTASLFIAHRDISRYVLPIVPFALIAFQKVLTTREFKIVLAIMLLGIYLYTQNFLIQNVAPFPNLEYYN